MPRKQQSPLLQKEVTVFSLFSVVSDECSSSTKEMGIMQKSFVGVSHGRDYLMVPSAIKAKIQPEMKDFVSVQ